MNCNLNGLKFLTSQGNKVYSKMAYDGNEEFFMLDAVCAIDGVQTSKACRFMICIKLANFYPH